MFIQSPRAFAEFVRSHRISAGMTQEDLSARTGMSRRWVQELESGKLVPSLEAALNVATAFGYELHLDPVQNTSHLDALFDELT
ncbi:helix-turn-helix domain-containing protein [Leucobacter luti]|uniref:helix-turn-helix domain-containing protein n=1 Tax=Leucobacter luti TaxID=340320 RepID=UPI003D0666D0